jgi:hypothetical protein
MKYLKKLIVFNYLVYLVISLNNNDIKMKYLKKNPEKPKKTTKKP